MESEISLLMANQTLVNFFSAQSSFHTRYLLFPYFRHHLENFYTTPSWERVVWPMSVIIPDCLTSRSNFILVNNTLRCIGFWVGYRRTTNERKAYVNYSLLLPGAFV